MEPQELIEQYVYDLQNINRYIRSGTFRGTASSITRVQWLILRYLDRKSDGTIGQLAAHLAVRSSTMSLMIDRLEKTKLVYRSTDSLDARIRIVRLTGDGKAMIRLAEDRWVDTLTVPFTRLTDRERRLLVQLTAKLAGGLAQNGMTVGQPQVE
jgi:DNA-binding MarR family transcriptional regulator